MNFEIYIESLTFYIEILHYTAPVPGNPLTWDSDWDYHGYDAEIEWRCNAVEDCLEDGTIIEVAVNIDEYEELITEKILALIAEMKQDDPY